MSEVATLPARDPSLVARADELFQDASVHLCARTDRMFAALMAIQWLAGVFAALLLSRARGQA